MRNVQGSYSAPLGNRYATLLKGFSNDLDASLYFYTFTGNWEKAHRLLKNNPTLTDLGDQLETYGKKLETMGRIKEAEKLYLALDKVDLAINMYKTFQRYDEVIA